MHWRMESSEEWSILFGRECLDIKDEQNKVIGRDYAFWLLKLHMIDGGLKYQTAMLDAPFYVLTGEGYPLYFL